MSSTSARCRTSKSNRSDRCNQTRPSACRACEPLERRLFLSTINWTDKGTVAVDTDNFNATYGANATLARNIVQRAIDDWERVIVDFNYTGGGNTFTLSLSATTFGGTLRGQTNNIGRNDAVQKKPISATIQLDNDGGGAGWYFDPVPGTSTVPDDGEFTTVTAPWNADLPGSTAHDFYRTSLHEIGHAMGILDSAGFLRIGDFLVNSGILDPFDAASQLRTINIGGGAIEYTLTQNGGGHLFEGGGGVVAVPSHPNMLLNAGRSVPTGTRRLISDTEAQLLEDVYGYTIAMPSTINTFYANLNTTTNVVTINGDVDDDGDNADVIDLEVAGTAMRFEVNGSSETIEGAQFTTIAVNAGADNDDIDVDALLSGKSMTVNGGAGNDSVDVSLEAGDVDTTVLSNFTFNGGSDSDTLRFHDTNDGVNSDTYEFTSTVASKAARDVIYSNLESMIINGSPQASTYNINSLSSTLTGGLTINAGAANDTITLGGTIRDIDSTIFANVQVNGGGGTDTMHFNDADDDASVDDSYTLTSIGFDKSSTSEVFGFSNMEHVILTAGLADNDITVLSMSQTIAPTLQSLLVNGNDGNDTIELRNDLDSNFAFVDVTLNGNAGTDALVLDDTADDGPDDYTITSTSFDKNTAGVTLFTYGTFENFTLNANNEDNTITTTGTISGPVRLNGRGGADTFDIVGNFAGTYVIVDGGAGLDNVNVNEDGVGVAAVQFVNSQDLQALNLFAFGSARVNAGGDKLLNTRTLSIAGNGRLDLTDNDMILDYAGATQLAAVQAWINQGRAGGLWNGFGITSSTAGANPQHNTTLGAMEATAFDAIYGAGATFNGVDPDNTAVLVKYTYYGDADFNGMVNFDDYSRSDAGFINNRTGWNNGDYNGDGVVNFDDYSLMDLAFNTQGAAL